MRPGCKSEGQVLETYKVVYGNGDVEKFTAARVFLRDEWLIFSDGSSEIVWLRRDRVTRIDRVRGE